MIEANGLCMRYGAFTALEDATFRAAKGEVVGLLGPNGAGKTTTMRILTSYLVPTSGTATVAGFDVVRDPLEVRRRIGYLPEQLPLYMVMEVQEYLRFVGKARGLGGARLKDRIDYVVDACSLVPKYHSPVVQLSKGYKQRTALAQALIHDPEVVVLDEPTTGLDPHQVVEIRKLIVGLAATKTVILSTHILAEAAAMSGRLVVVSDGRIAGSGTIDELVRQAGIATEVRLCLADAPAEAEAALAELPGAAAVRRDGGAFVVTESETGLSGRIGALCAKRGWVVTELSRRSATLEDAFLTLTKRKVAHAAAGSAA